MAIRKPDWLPKIFLSNDSFKAAAVSYLGSALSGYTGPINPYLLGQGVALWNGSDNGLRYVRDGYMSNENVFICVRKILDKAIQSQWVLYDTGNTSQQKLNQYKSLSFRTDLTAQQRVAEIKSVNNWKEVESHKFLDKMDKPNPYQSRTEFQENLIGYLELTGNTFGYVQRPIQSNRDTDNWFILPAHQIVIVRGDNQFGKVAGYKFATEDPTTAVRFTPDEIIHLKYFNPESDRGYAALYGQSPLLALLRRLQASNEGFSDYVKDNATGGLFGFVSARQENTIVGEDQEMAFRNRLNMAAASSNPVDRIFVTGSPMDWTQIGFSPAEKNVLAKFQADLSAFGLAYGIPLSLLSSDASTDNNSENHKKEFINGKITNVLSMVRDFYNQILQQYGRNLYLDFDISAYPEMADDMKDLSDWLDKSWWISPNQKLVMQKFGKSKNPLMDEPFIPSGLTALSEYGMDDQPLPDVADDEL